MTGWMVTDKEAVVECLCESSSPQIRAAVQAATKQARGASASAIVRAVTASQGLLDVQHAVARSPDCPEEILVRLANHKKTYIRSAVASNARCPEQTLMALIRGDSPYVRQLALEHQNCSAATLVAVIQGECPPDAQKAVLKHHKCPSYLQAVYWS